MLLNLYITREIIWKLITFPIKCVILILEFASLSLYQKAQIPLLVLVTMLGLHSCEKYEEAPLVPEQTEEQEYIEDQRLMVTVAYGTLYADNQYNEVTLSEGESGELSLVFNNNNGRVVFRDITLDFAGETQLTTPNVTREGTTTTVYICFTDCSEGFVTYNLEDVRTSNLYRYTYLIHTEKRTDKEEDSPQKEGEPDDKDEPEEEEEPLPPLHLTIENKRYISENTPLEIILSSNREIEELTGTYSISLQIDEKDTEFETEPKEDFIILTCPSVPQKTGRHSIKIKATPVNQSKEENTFETESVFYLVHPHHHWFRDRELTSEIYVFQNIFNDRKNTLSWFKVELDGTEGNQPMVTVHDKTEGTTLKKYGSNIFLLETPARGEHTFDITYRLANLDTTITDTKKVIDEFVCTPFISGSSIYATTSGPHGITADLTTDFTVYGVIRAVIPYTEAISEWGSNYTQDKYEYINFQWVKTTFQQKAGSTLRTFTIHEGWINTALKWSKAKMSGVTAQQNGASRWVTKDGKEVVEYYTPIPFLQVALYYGYQNYEGKEPEYAIWSFDGSNIRAWLQENGIGLAEYLLN